MNQVKKVVLTGAAGQIAYNLVFRIASGEMFGPNTPLSLSLLEVPEMLKGLEGIKMELEDGAYPLLKEIKIASDPFEAFEGIDVALLIGAKPRGPGMERKDLLTANGKIFVEQGRALDKTASKNVKVFVIGNPCNTNAYIAMENAPSISRRNFFAMTRLDQNRAAFQLASRARVPVTEVKKVFIWGNHSSTQVPDFTHATIQNKSVRDVIQDQDWLENAFVTKVQKRGAEVIEARGKSSAGSASQAIIDWVSDMYRPHIELSSGVYSENNSYEIDPSLIFSFPIRTKGEGEWEFIEGLKLDGWLLKKLAITQRELVEERDSLREFARII